MLLVTNKTMTKLRPGIWDGGNLVNLGRWSSYEGGQLRRYKERDKCNATCTVLALYVKVIRYSRKKEKQHSSNPSPINPCEVRITVILLEVKGNY